VDSCLLADRAVIIDLFMLSAMWGELLLQYKLDVKRGGNKVGKLHRSEEIFE
jgi:hypothetical protein